MRVPGTAVFESLLYDQLELFYTEIDLEILVAVKVVCNNY